MTTNIQEYDDNNKNKDNGVAQFLEELKTRWVLGIEDESPPPELDEDQITNWGAAFDSPSAKEALTLLVQTAKEAQQEIGFLRQVGSVLCDQRLERSAAEEVKTSNEKCMPTSNVSASPKIPSHIDKSPQPHQFSHKLNYILAFACTCCVLLLVFPRSGPESGSESGGVKNGAKSGVENSIEAMENDIRIVPFHNVLVLDCSKYMERLESLDDFKNETLHITTISFRNNEWNVEKGEPFNFKASKHTHVIVFDDAIQAAVLIVSRNESPDFDHKTTLSHAELEKLKRDLRINPNYFLQQFDFKPHLNQ